MTGAMSTFMPSIRHISTFLLLPFRPALNENLLHAYVEFIANKRLKALGLKTIYDRPLNTNPLPWTQHWLSSAGLQVAPQETEVESYLIGGIKQDVEKDTFKGFSL